MAVEDAFEGAVRVLDADGGVVGEEPALDEATLLGIYRDMRLARRFDERAVSLQRQGRLGTYAPLEGQEAAQVGGTYPMADDDWLVYQYREHGALAVRGLSPAYLLYWMGHEIGTADLVDRKVAPLNITIADQLPHAAGLAWGADYRGDDAVVVCHFGDGATSEGDFHEAMNVAGVFDLPVVFVCNNNQYAISVPRADQTASETIAAKAEAYGMRGVRVDGMDPLACYRVFDEAIRRARAGGGTERGPDPGGGAVARTDDGDDVGGTADPERRSGDEVARSDDGDRRAGGGRAGAAADARYANGGTGRGATRPTLIETVMYRFGPHTTADDPGVYRDDEEVDRWRAYDPLPRYEAYLRGRGLLDDERVAAIGAEVDERVAALIDEAETYEPDPASMFDHAFAETPPEIRRQRESFEATRAEHGDDSFLRD